MLLVIIKYGVIRKFSYQAAIAMLAVAKGNAGDGKKAKIGKSAAKPLNEWNVHRLQWLSGILTLRDCFRMV